MIPQAFNLYVGTRVGSNGALLGDVHVRETIVYVLSKNRIGGATISRASGLWRGKSEPTRVVYLSGITATQAQTVAAELAASLEQESVGLQVANPLQFVRAV